MANVVDSLVVTLQLDPSGFAKGAKVVDATFKKTKDQAVKTGKTMEESNKSLVGSFDKLKNEALGFFSILLGARGVKEFVANVNSANASLGRFAANMGLSAQTVAGFEMAVESLGGTAEGALASLRNITGELYEWRFAGHDLPREISLLNDTFKNLTGRDFDREHGAAKLMTEMAIAAKELAKSDPNKAFEFLTRSGIDDGTAQAMIKTGAAFKDLIEAQKALAPSKQQIEDSQKLNSAFTDVLHTSGKIAASIESWSTGPLLSMLKTLNDALLRLENYNETGKASPHAQAVIDAISGPNRNANAPRSMESIFNGMRGRGIHPSSSGGFRLLHPGTWFGGDADAPVAGGHDSAAKMSAADLEAITGVKVGGRDVSKGNPMPVWFVDNNNLGTSGTDIAKDAPENNRPGGNGAHGGAVEMMRRRARHAPGGANNYPTGETPTAGAATATSVVSRLMKDYGLTRTQAVGAAGVMGYESGNFQTMQEVGQAPGHGGWGWAQWTGPRRTAFMNWARDHKLEPSSDAANYGFLQHELATNYSHVIPIMKRQNSVDSAAYAWERYFEGMTEGGPGVPAFAAHQARARAYDKIVPQDPLAGSAWNERNPAPPSWVSGASLSSMSNTHHVTTSSTSNEMHIGRIDINAGQATDANGIAAGFGPALARHGFAAMANSGQM